MMPEKIEECPGCGADNRLKGWVYDFQICTHCGYGGPTRPPDQDIADACNYWKRRYDDVLAQRDERQNEYLWTLRQIADGTAADSPQARVYKDMARLALGDLFGPEPLKMLPLPPAVNVALAYLEEMKAQINRAFAIKPLS